MSYLSRMYCSNDSDESAEAYLKEHEVELLMATDDDCAILLTELALGLSHTKVPSNKIGSLEAKGLIKKIEDGYLITERGERLVSNYPAFGTQGPSRRLNDAFFPMLLSSVVSKELSTRSTHWTRYFSSDFFLGLFPAANKEEISRFSTLAVKALLSLGIIRDNLGRMTIRKDSALSFMDLSIEDKLSWILYPNESDIVRNKAAKAFNLAYRLRGIKEDEIDSYMERIERITEFTLPPLQTMLDIGVLYLEDGIINGYDTEAKKAEDGVVSSDFILSYSGSTDKPIFLICQPEKADVTKQWSITKQSLKSAFSMGYTPNDVFSILSEISTLPLPDSLRSRIESWYESYNALTSERGVILTCDIKNSKILESLPLLRIHVLSHPSENIFIMNPSTEEEWRRVLHFSGFDMLGETKGWEMHRPEKERVFLGSKKPPLLKERREIPFSKALRGKLLAKSKSTLRSHLIKEGLIFTDENKEHLDAIEGLYYQEKLKLISGAIENQEALYIDNANEITIETPLRLEREGEDAYLITDSKKHDVSKIWRLGALPGFIKSQD